MGKLRLCFAGTPEFAAAHLSALLQSSHEVVAVFTQPDRPAGRGRKLLASPVKQIAVSHAVPVFQSGTLRSEEPQQILKNLQLDVLVVVAYGLILPQVVLDIPRFGCINVHASLLPRWRGAAPIERAILAGDKETGVTIMQMDAGLDTGDMLYRQSVNIDTTDTRVDLEAKLQRSGEQALLYTLDNLAKLRKAPTRQSEEGSSYAEKLQKAESQVNWEQSAEAINRTIRAGIGRSPAYSFLEGDRLRLLKATPSPDIFDAAPGTIVDAGKDYFKVACQTSSLRITSVQLPGKKPASVRDISNSRPALFPIGKQFSSSEALPE